MLQRARIGLVVRAFPLIVLMSGSNGYLRYANNSASIQTTLSVCLGTIFTLAIRHLSNIVNIPVNRDISQR